MCTDNSKKRKKKTQKSEQTTINNCCCQLTDNRTKKKEQRQHHRKQAGNTRSERIIKNKTWIVRTQHFMEHIYASHWASLHWKEDGLLNRPMPIDSCCCYASPSTRLLFLHRRASEPTASWVVLRISYPKRSSFLVNNFSKQRALHVLCFAATSSTCLNHFRDFFAARVPWFLSVMCKLNVCLVPLYSYLVQLVHCSYEQYVCLCSLR